MYSVIMEEIVDYDVRIRGYEHEDAVEALKKSIVYPKHLKEDASLEEILRSYGLFVEWDEKDINGIYTSTKVPLIVYKDIFDRLAPFMDERSFIEFVDGSYDRYCWYILDGKCFEEKAKIVYDNADKMGF